VACLFGLASCKVLILDDDCEQPQLAAGEEALVNWQEFRNMLHEPPSELHSVAAWHVMRNENQAREQCPLGVAAACLYIVGLADVPRIDQAQACMSGITLIRALHTRWTLLKLLVSINNKTKAGGSTPGGLWNCDDTYHPSLDWRMFRSRVGRYADEFLAWFDSKRIDAVPEIVQEVSHETSGVYWKSFSETAAVDGRTVRSWTQDCSHGLICTHGIRLVTLLFIAGDVYRMVQRSLEILAPTFESRLDELLESSWPSLAILQIAAKLRYNDHDQQLLAADLAPLPPAWVPGASLEDLRSPFWHRASKALWQRSGGGAGVILTPLDYMHMGLIQPMLKRARRLNYLQNLAIIPLKQNMTWLCSSIASGFLANHPDSPEAMGESRCPCLPHVSGSMGKAQYMYIALALQLGVPVLWSDLRIVWQQSPMQLFGENLVNPAKPVVYHHGCRTKQPAKEPPDVYVVDEFYAERLVRPSLVLFSATAATKQLVDVMLTFLSTFPYANEHLGLRYLLYPETDGWIPSVSGLPAPDELPRIVVGELDAEKAHATTNGWFGSMEEIVSFEVSNTVSDHMSLLQELYEGTEEKQTELLQRAHKVVSALRPVHFLYMPEEDRPKHFQAKCAWEHSASSYIGEHVEGAEQRFESLEEAKALCQEVAGCHGVTCEQASQMSNGAWTVQGCTLRRGNPPLAASPTNEGSFVKRCPNPPSSAKPDGCNPQPIQRIVHVNYADGCCEVEQNLSSSTALQFGATESRPLRGEFLDDEFRKKNDYLLKFNRTPDLTLHKTPSGKIGYYVWKPYVILRTLQDPSLEWETTVIVWSDAGVHFVGDMLPLVHEFMSRSDVAATRTPMTESEFTKRDAFILLDADYVSIAETRQMATGFIILRKTRLALEFLAMWLRACEEPRIMTELPSVLGMPDHPGFRNNNDDQSAFSLLFKRFGFASFSVDQRDAVVHTGRNLAKFIKASDDFALGKSSSRDDYLQAANAAADAAAKS